MKLQHIKWILVNEGMILTQFIKLQHVKWILVNEGMILLGVKNFKQSGCRVSV